MNSIVKNFFIKGLNHNFNLNVLNYFSTKILAYKDLPHKSVEINVESLNVDDTSDFAAKLYETINYLKVNNKQTIYLKVPMLFSHYITLASMYGFKYHRAENDTAYLMLWLPKGECKVPLFATHHCGVGSALYCDNKLLVVREHGKYNKLVGWKLPGGYVGLGEDFSTAAVREVYEETGVKSEFQSILSVRHSHNVQFGRSDVYIVCRLNAVTTSITVDNEIEDAQWIDINELEKNTSHAIMLSTIKLLKSNVNGLVEETHPSVIPGRLPYKLYLPSTV